MGRSGHKTKFELDMQKALGVTSAEELARKYECPRMQYETDPHCRMTVYWPKKGQWHEETIRLKAPHPSQNTPYIKREDHFDAAAEWARKNGPRVEEWGATGYPDSWVPIDVRRLFREELERWRKTQR